MWVIRLKETGSGTSNEPLYWSNHWGWGSLEGCEEYTDSEKLNNRLPIDAEWVDGSAKAFL